MQAAPHSCRLPLRFLQESADNTPRGATHTSTHDGSDDAVVSGVGVIC